MGLKGITLALATIAVASLFVGGSAYAWYSDEVTLAGNKFTPGTLYMTVNESKASSSFLGDVFPGWGTDAYPETEEMASQFISAINIDTGPRKLYMSFENLVDIILDDSTNGASIARLSEQIYIKGKWGFSGQDTPNPAWWLHSGRDLTIKEVSDRGPIYIMDLDPYPGDVAWNIWSIFELSISYYVKEGNENIRPGTSLSFDIVLTLM